MPKGGFTVSYWDKNSKILNDEIALDIYIILYKQLTLYSSNYTLLLKFGQLFQNNDNSVEIWLKIRRYF